MTAKQILKECDLFSGLSDGELDKVAGSVTEKRFEAGTTIFTEGSNAEELLVLQEGRVAIQVTLPKTEGLTGRRVTVDVVTKNDVVGWSAIVEPYKYNFTAVCTQNALALSLNASKLRALLRENPKTGYEVFKGLTSIIASRLHDTRQVLISERLLSGSN